MTLKYKMTCQRATQFLDEGAGGVAKWVPRAFRNYLKNLEQHC